jgi:hypothetical protein
MELNLSHLFGDMDLIPEFGGEDNGLIELETCNMLGK